MWCRWWYETDRNAKLTNFGEHRVITLDLTAWRHHKETWGSEDAASHVSVIMIPTYISLLLEHTVWMSWPTIPNSAQHRRCFALQLLAYHLNQNANGRYRGHRSHLRSNCRNRCWGLRQSAAWQEPTMRSSGGEDDGEGEGEGGCSYQSWSQEDLEGFAMPESVRWSLVEKGETVCTSDELQNLSLAAGRSWNHFELPATLDYCFTMMFINLACTLYSSNNASSTENLKT